MLYKFGDVFRYREKEYVYWVETENITYAAKILDLEETVLLNKTCTALFKNAESRPRALNLDICYFVMLTTVPFNNRAVPLVTAKGGDVSGGFNESPEKICSLNEGDLEKMKKEIKDALQEGMLPNDPVLKKIIE